MSTLPANPPAEWPAAIIPLHYHYNMLNDEVRMTAFESAIRQVVKPGSKVLELGGGSAVMSFLAAKQGASVTCVEIEPPTAEAARNMLKLNHVADQVEVITASALDYLPDEPVDVVICEMVHVAMLREKQVEVMDSFRRRYLEKFGAPLPTMIPTASILAVQLVEQDFIFHGYVAPVPIFQQSDIVQNRTNELSEPSVTHILDFGSDVPHVLTWSGTLQANGKGNLNGIRFITKNVLAINHDVNPPTTVDWFSQYMILPISEPMEAEEGATYQLSFTYPIGAEISSLQSSLQLVRVEVEDPDEEA